MPNSLRGLVYALCHLLADKHFLFPSHWAKDKPLNSKGLYASHCFATTAWPMRLLEHQRYKSSHYSPLLFRRAPHKLQKCCAWFSLWRDHCSESHREQGSCLQERVSVPTDQQSSFRSPSRYRKHWKFTVLPLLNFAPHNTCRVVFANLMGPSSWYSTQQ